MKKVVLIIQARMGSIRLPGKSMMPLYGEPLVYRLIERVKRCTLVDEIVLAIPKTKENNILIPIAKRAGIRLFRGLENNLVDRYFNASLASKADIICRLPADNPVPEFSEIDRIIDFHKSKNDHLAFSTNLSEIEGSGYPDGIGAEVFNIELLEEIYKNMDNLSNLEKEHLHLNFYDYDKQTKTSKSACNVYTITCPKGFRRPDLVLDVNTQDEYVFMRNLYNYLYPKNINFSILDIINWYDNVYKKSNIV